MRSGRTTRTYRKGLAARTPIALSAAGYGVIAFSAARIVLDNGSGASGNLAETEERQQLVVAQVLSGPPAHGWWAPPARLWL